jgi:hypothetical protein
LGTYEKLTIAGCQYTKDVSGHMVFHVNTSHALMTAIGYLKHTAQPWERIFLRGQTALYDTLSPSLYRGLTYAQSQGKRHERLRQVVSEFSSASSLFKNLLSHAQEPLLQHYGIQTTWLDIVDNVWIALWFALHHAVVSGSDSQYLHFDGRVSENEGDFGYLILIKTEDDRKEKAVKGLVKGNSTEVVDLRIAAPSVFLRPHAQHGLLFRARGGTAGRKSDYSHCIAGIIRFPLQQAKLWLGMGAMHEVRGLFPPPFYDNGYQILLGVTLKERRIGVINHIGA